MKIGKVTKDKDIAKQLIEAWLEVDVKKVSDDTTASIEKAVKAARYNKEWRAEYMRRSLFEIDARREGIAIGEERGEKRGKEELLIAMVKDGIIDIVSAAKYLDIPETEFKKYMSTDPMNS